MGGFGFAGTGVRGGSALLRIGGTPRLRSGQALEAAVSTWLVSTWPVSTCLVFTCPVGMFGLEDEAGVFLIAFGREADVVELDFIGAGLRYELG